MHDLASDLIKFPSDDQPDATTDAPKYIMGRKWAYILDVMPLLVADVLTDKNIEASVMSTVQDFAATFQREYKTDFAALHVGLGSVEDRRCIRKHWALAVR